MSIKQFIRKYPFLLKILDYRYLLIYLKEKFFSGRNSYAQYGDDLKTLELIGPVKTFVDIGANDGFSESNSFLFGKKGAKGICFEPTPSIFNKLDLLYKFNSNVICRNFGISDENKEFEIISNGVLSYIEDTLDEKHKDVLNALYDKNVKKEKIVLKRFEDALTGSGLSREIDLLTIDVEGHELNVLRSIPFNRYSFKLIIVETHTKDKENKTIWIHRDIESINSLLKEHGYLKVFENTCNSFYLKK